MSKPQVFLLIVLNLASFAAGMLVSLLLRLAFL